MLAALAAAKTEGGDGIGLELEDIVKLAIAPSTASPVTVESSADFPPLASGGMGNKEGAVLNNGAQHGAWGPPSHHRQLQQQQQMRRVPPVMLQQPRQQQQVTGPSWQHILVGGQQQQQRLPPRMSPPPQNSPSYASNFPRAQMGRR